MENFTWILASILAAVFQTSRTAYQKKLAPLLGNYGSAYTRFIMGLPFTLCLWAAWLIYEQDGFPNLNLRTLSNLI